MQKPKKGAEQAKAFGHRVQQTRKARGMTQEKLAELSDLHRTYVGHVERGEVNVALYNILRLASALQVDPADLVAGLKP